MSLLGKAIGVDNLDQKTEQVQQQAQQKVQDEAANRLKGLFGK